MNIILLIVWLAFDRMLQNLERGTINIHVNLKLRLVADCV